MRMTRLAVGLALLLMTAAPRPAAAQGPGTPAVGRTLYEGGCSTCHGRGGKGDGPAAAILTPKPGDHTSGKYMNALSDDFLFTIIRKGGAEVKRSSKMPPAPSRLSDRDVQDLVAYVRSLAANPPYRPKAQPSKR